MCIDIKILLNRFTTTLRQVNSIVVIRIMQSLVLQIKTFNTIKELDFDYVDK